MKLNDLYLTHPEIFVQLTLQQQIYMLDAAGLGTHNLHSPLTECRISQENHYEDMWTFSGHAQRMLLETTTYIAYWNDHFRLEFAR
jgi:hypothetical protein